MVIFTRWYWSPRERGGDCHHLSVPSIAYSIEWSLEGTLGSQWSQDRPRMPSFPGTVANLQNNSDSLTSSPHVEVASIFLPWAMLIAGGLSLCPSPDLTAKLTTKRACKIANTGFFIVETLIPRASVHIDDTVIKRANRELFVPGKMRGVQITLGVGCPWRLKNSPISRHVCPLTTKKKTTQFMNSRTFCFIRLSRLGGWLVFLSFLSPYIQDATLIQLFVINVKNGWFFSPLSFFNLQNYTVKRSNPFSLIILVSLHMMIQVYNHVE